MRKNIATDQSSKRVMAIANQMKRASYIADIEYKYCLALSYPLYPLGEKSAYFETITEYMAEFVDRFDVVSDVRNYLHLFSSNEAAALRGFVRKHLDEEEGKYVATQDAPPSINLIRWRLVFFKLNKLLGAFTLLEKEEKLKLVNTIMQTYLWAQNKGDQLSDVDHHCLGDLIIVAVEILMEIKLYDGSVLNPINFMIITIAEYAIKFSPDNNGIRILLLKAYAKLGLTSKFSGVSSNVKGLEDD